MEFYDNKITTEPTLEVNKECVPVIGYTIEEKIRLFDSSSNKDRYYFVISNPVTYQVKTIEVGKVTFIRYHEGEKLQKQ